MRQKKSPRNIAPEAFSLEFGDLENLTFANHSQVSCSTRRRFGEQYFLPNA